MLDLTINTRDIVLSIGLLLTVVGLCANFVQLRRNWRVQKAQFLTNITNDLFDDNDLRKFFYKIDYDKFQFSETRLRKFKGSDDERHLDALLYRYNLLGRLVRMKLLDIKEIEFLIFEIAQVFKNTQVLKYIQWLETEYQKHGTLGTNQRTRPYDDARWLIETLSKPESYLSWLLRSCFYRFRKHYNN